MLKGTINKLKIVGITAIVLIAAPLGFGGFATSFAGVAKILFVVFLILAVLPYLGSTYFQRRTN